MNFTELSLPNGREPRQIIDVSLLFHAFPRKRDLGLRETRSGAGKRDRGLEKRDRGLKKVRSRKRKTMSVTRKRDQGLRKRCREPCQTIDIPLVFHAFPRKTRSGAPENKIGAHWGLLGWKLFSTPDTLRPLHCGRHPRETGFMKPVS